MFCISTINFVDATKAYSGNSDDEQLDTSVSSVSALKPSVASLSTVTTYPSLPQTNSMGVCEATSALRLRQSAVG